MKIFTLKEAEKWFHILDNLVIKHDNLVKIESKKKRNFLDLQYTCHIEAINSDENRQLRIIYLIRHFSNYNKDYKLVDYNIVGNYDDVILRLEPKESQEFPHLDY